MKLRWNLIYLITLAFCFTAYLAWQNILPGELLGGLAGSLITLVAAVSRELIEDKPSGAARIGSMFTDGDTQPCQKCNEVKDEVDK